MLCERMIEQHNKFLRSLEEGWVPESEFIAESPSADVDDAEWEEFLKENDDKSPADEFDVVKLKADVEADLQLLKEFQQKAASVLNDKDPKLDSLVEELASIAAEAKDSSPTEEEAGMKRKVLIFTYFKYSALSSFRELRLICLETYHRGTLGLDFRR